MKVIAEKTGRRTAIPMKYKRFLYHVTDSENVESILRKGLLRGGGKRQAAFVCLSKKPLSWWYPGAKILRVDIKDLMGKWSDFLSESDEILFWGDIPAERIKVYEPTAVEHIKMFNSNLYDWRKKETEDDVADNDEE